MESLDFEVDLERCIGCETCVSDCPLRVLTMEEDVPAVVADRASMCIKCLHCLTVCPSGAVSIGGFGPDDCLGIEGMFPESDKMEALIRGRRSVRRYQDENVDPAVMERLLQVAWQAPTGVNARNVLFTVVDNGKTMDRLRNAIMDRLSELSCADKLPEHLEFFSGFVKLWEEKGIDTLFRGAPHMIVATAPKNCPCPEQDCIIALSYFELFAQTLGLGTVWDGLAKLALTELMPEFVEKLGIPGDHTFGYVMAFGKPAVEYHRTVPMRTAAVNRVSF
ncbi:MAG: nitroreductase family protein [Desulfobulbaceae bacterium]|nr:nitroreductase family protein [Desulfobulbaceae bacterium]